MTVEQYSCNSSGAERLSHVRGTRASKLLEAQSQTPRPTAAALAGTREFRVRVKRTTRGFRLEAECPFLPLVPYSCYSSRCNAQILAKAPTTNSPARRAPHSTNATRGCDSRPSHSILLLLTRLTGERVRRHTQTADAAPLTSQPAPSIASALGISASSSSTEDVL